MNGALAGVTVIDFSTLLPGPLATLLLAEAGAEVIKIERPGGGDEMRFFPPLDGEESALFPMLSRGKRSISADLKSDVGRERVLALLDTADVLVEQFRPGVMDRLGLGYDALRARNPGLIYCAITGYGQSGARAGLAGHDLNYVAQTGMLALAAYGASGAPVVPPVLLADIAGGSYPAVMNVAFALIARATTGRGCKLDIAMADNVFPLLFAALAAHGANQPVPGPGAGPFTGGSPRYAIYPTADGRFLAAAPIEERFWQAFCDAIELPVHLRAGDPVARDAVAALVRARTSGEWTARFAGRDVCAVVVASVEEALADENFRARGLFEREVSYRGKSSPAMPVPVCEPLRVPDRSRAAPPLESPTVDAGFPAKGAWF